MPNVLDYSLADFFYNDSQNVLNPPSDFMEWANNPAVLQITRFFEQQLLEAPNARTEVLSNIDNQRREVINLTSYNYLGLSSHPEVIEAAKEALEKYGMSSSGAPLLSGTFDLHIALAQKLASFKGQEDCILYSSGLGGNMGAIQGLLRKGDILILDEKCHKSLVDGGTLAGAKMLFFEHNSMNSLEAMLEKGKNRRTLVCVEGVYSMDGDLVDLPGVVERCQAAQVPIYIDEAHSTLMFGKHGRGVAEHFDLEDAIGISFGTLSKSFGGVGGFVCSNAPIIKYLKGYSSPWNFSCAPSPAIVGGLTKALEVATRDDSLRRALWNNVDYFVKALKGLNLDIGQSQSQVIPIIIGSSGEQLFRMATELQRRGLFLQPVDFPAVPAHARRFRISVSSQLTKAQIDYALNVIEDVIVQEFKSAS